MIFSLSGVVQTKEENFAVIETGGVGFRIFAPARTLADLSSGESITIYTHLHVQEDALSLYGFTKPAELKFFELLIGVSGVGPKSALAILDVAELNDLCAAIEQGRPDLLTRASGVGRKTAERVIVDLKGKVRAAESEGAVRRMEGDSDLVETLVDLGYRRDQARAAVGNITDDVSDLTARLKAALKILGTRK